MATCFTSFLEVPFVLKISQHHILGYLQTLSHVQFTSNSIINLLLLINYEMIWITDLRVSYRSPYCKSGSWQHRHIFHCSSGYIFCWCIILKAEILSKIDFRLRRGIMICNILLWLILQRSHFCILLHLHSAGYTEIR